MEGAEAERTTITAPSLKASGGSSIVPYIAVASAASVGPAFSFSMYVCLMEVLMNSVKTIYNRNGNQVRESQTRI